ncbi:MAG: hypothetical protein AAF629_28960, partial [Chloroflexota bacterium]
DFGETWVYTVAYTVQPDDVEPLINIGQVAALETNGTPIPIVTDTHSLQIEYAPAITMSASGDVSAGVGQTTTFIYDVSIDPTIGDGSPIQNISIVDTIAGVVTSGPTIITGDSDAFLETGEVWRYTASYVIAPTDPNPLINVGTVSGEDLDGDSIMPVDDSHETAISFAPVLAVTKTGPSNALIGESIVYTITVSHDASSDDSAVNTVIVDDDLTSNETLIGGDDNSNMTLDAGETWTYIATYTTSLSDPDPLINTVSVDGKNIDGFDITTAQASHDTDLDYEPAFTLQISVSETGVALVGQTLAYTYVVSYDNINGDGSSISSVVISDTIPGSITGPSGDDGDGVLESGESWIFNTTHIVQPDDVDPFANTVTVTGVDRDVNGLPAQMQSLSTPIEFLPVIEFKKTGQTTAEVGDTVVYSFVISHANTSDNSSIDINTVAITDSLFGVASFDQNSDTNDNDLLDVGEIWKFIVQHTIVVADSDPIVNQGTLTALDRDSDQISLLSNMHSLDIDFQPGFQITTNAPTAANVGETIVFSYTVMHLPNLAESDRSPISNVVVTNNIPGTATFVSGDSNGNNLLDFNETWVFEATYVVVETVAFSHIGIVNGTDADGEPLAQDTDTKTVIVGAMPILSISKSGPSQAIAGDEIMYTLAVTNSGLVQANNVVITDRVPNKVTYLTGADVVSDSIASWNLPALAAGSSTVVTFTGKILDTSTNNSYVAQADGGIAAAGVQSVMTKVTHRVGLPIVLGPVIIPMTKFIVFNDNTGGDVTFEIRELNGTLVLSCVVPNNATQDCGELPSGTYLVSVFSACGNLTNIEKTYAEGEDIERLSCEASRISTK